MASPLLALLLPPLLLPLLPLPLLPLLLLPLPLPLLAELRAGQRTAEAKAVLCGV